MEAAAENGKEIIVLDRPNPHDGYTDGPVLKEKWTSFVGLHKVPVVYGLTIGEYGKMVNGEKWMKNAVQVKYTLIPMLNYHKNKDIQFLKNLRLIYQMINLSTSILVFVSSKERRFL